MRMRVMTVLGVVAMVRAATAGQQTADFSGTWRFAKGATSSMAAAPARCPAKSSDAASWTTRRTHPAGSRARHRSRPRVPIDGSEQRAVSPSRACLADTGTMSSLAWDGTALVYTLVSTIGPGGTPGSSVGLKYIFRLEAPDRLVIGQRCATRHRDNCGQSLRSIEVDRCPRRGATAGRGRHEGHDRGCVVDRGPLDGARRR